MKTVNNSFEGTGRHRFSESWEEKVASQDPHMTEWETARKMLGEFDQRLHDLRKTGFSFITALLAAEALLIPGPIAAAAGDPGVPDTIKLAVMIVTLVLIVGVNMMERNYQLFQQAAAQRALILERKMNLELTEVITGRHRWGFVGAYEWGVYIALVFSDFFIGVFILHPNYEMIYGLLAGSLLATGLITAIKILSLHTHEKEDWTLEPLRCKRRGSVMITLTNLKTQSALFPRKVSPKEAITLRPGDVAWKIIDHNRSDVYEEKVPAPITVGPEDSYVWPWNTQSNTGEHVAAGIYLVVPSAPLQGGRGRRLWPRPLRRKILVVEEA